MKPNRFKRWTLSDVILFLFAAASFVIARHADAEQARADGNRVFELRIYYVLPGKLPALEARFRDTTSKLLAKHDLKIVGYWVGDDNTFVFMVAHSSREEAKKNWDALRVDPEFQAVMKSEQTDKLVEKVDSTYLRPTGFSQIK